jgi:predicted porin
LSNPQVTDDNGGRQLAGRVALHPVAGLVVGGSAASGAFVSQSAVRTALPDARGGDFTQTAWGGDIEYSRAYYLVRLETVISRWTLPVAQPPLTELPLTAIATSVEGRYKILPGLYAAARVDHLGFSEVEGSAARESWDAPVNRWEVGGGYSLQRNLVLKLAYQRNRRDGGRVQDLGLGTAQIVFWF